MSQFSTRPIADWQNLLDWADKKVKAGRFEETRLTFKLQSVSSCPYEYRALFSDIYRRMGDPRAGAKLLRFLFVDKLFEPNDFQKMVYANCISDLGDPKAAELLYQQIDNQKLPIVDLRRAFALFNRWEYAKSIALLERYCRSPGLDSYSLAVGRINLLAALVSSQNWIQALELCDELELLLRNNNYTLLLANLLELKAQIFFHKGCYETAIKLCLEGIDLIQDENSIYNLFLKKWLSLSEAFASPTTQNILNIESNISNAKKQNAFEVVRDLEAYLAVVTNNHTLSSKVHFGTPYRSFKVRLLKFEAYQNLNLPVSYIPECASNFVTQENVEIKFIEVQILELFKNNKLTSRLVRCLLSDLYRPMSALQIFTFVFKEIYTDPEYVHAKVKNIIYRVNLELKEVGLFIESQKTLYQLKRLNNISVSISKPTRKQEIFVGPQIITLPKSRFFSAKIFATENKFHIRSAQNYLKILVNSNRISISGKGKNTIYKRN